MLWRSFFFFFKFLFFIRAPILLFIAFSRNLQCLFYQHSLDLFTRSTYSFTFVLLAFTNVPADICPMHVTCVVALVVVTHSVLRILVRVDFDLIFFNSYSRQPTIFVYSVFSISFFLVYRTASSIILNNFDRAVLISSRSCTTDIHIDLIIVVSSDIVILFIFGFDFPLINRYNF